MTGTRAVYGNQIKCFAKKVGVLQTTESLADPFENLLKTAEMAIRQGECERARTILKTAATENIENPEIYNLFGISYEKEGDRLKASKFYRVSYYMDQTFRAASENLDRVGRFWYDGFSNVAWGLETGGENK